MLRADRQGRLGALALLLSVSVGGAGCKILEATTGGPGSVCAAAGDCDDGLVCLAGRCGDAGTVGEDGLCWATRDCAQGLYCSPFARCEAAGDRGEDEPCGSDAQCQAGLRCELTGLSGTCQASGTGELGASCTAHSDCLAGLWCSPEMTCEPLLLAFPPYAGVTCEDEGAFRAYFEVPRPGLPPKDFYRLPFPNDARVGDGGALDLSDFPRPGPTPLGVDLVALYVDAWTADFDGFSPAAVVSFRFSDELDFGTVDGAALQFVDVTPGDPAFGAGRPSYGWSYSTGRTKYSCENRLTVQTGLEEPLLGGHTYAVILRNTIKSAGGQSPVADADLGAVLAEAAPADATLARVWAQYAPLREYLATKGIPAAEVAAATVFTVQDATAPMKSLAEATLAQPAPVLTDLVLCDTGVASPCDDGDQRVCGAASPDFYEIHGRFSVPIFQEGTAPYLEPADGGGIARDGQGAPLLQRSEDVCFALTIPKSSPPGGGWPLVVYHHGTGGSMRSFVGDGTAARLATAATPMAAFGFDAVNHGARRGASTIHPNELVFNPLNPRAARDNFLQGAADVLQAFRVAGLVVEAGASPTGAELRFDPAKTLYFGHSQGGTSGELAMAFSDAASAVVFSGAGAYLTTSLLEKSSPVDISGGMSFLIGEPLDGGHPVMTIFQSFFDRSDPLHYDPLIVRRPPEGVAAKHVYMSYGPGDTYSPSGTLKANARALGLAPVTPILEDYGTPAVTRPISENMTAGDGRQVTAACFQYQPADYDGHFVAQRNAAAAADWLAFFSSFLATGTPTVP